MDIVIKYPKTTTRFHSVWAASIEFGTVYQIMMILVRYSSQPPSGYFILQTKCSAESSDDITPLSHRSPIRFDIARVTNWNLKPTGKFPCRIWDLQHFFYVSTEPETAQNIFFAAACPKKKCTWIKKNCWTVLFPSGGAWTDRKRKFFGGYLPFGVRSITKHRRDVELVVFALFAVQRLFRLQYAQFVD